MSLCPDPDCLHDVDDHDATGCPDCGSGCDLRPSDLIVVERDALLAKFEALAEAWADVLAECKAADPKWILDRSVVALDTARRDLCAVIKEARA